MSRQNKVNPGMYTQRGRLTQDDAARELRKQSALASTHTWQPVNTRTRPWLGPAGHAARDAERPADAGTMVETSPQVEKRPASRVTRKTTAARAASSTARTKAAKAKTVTTRKSTRTTGKAKTTRPRTAKAKTGKARTTAMKRTTTKPTRKAARGTKRRKS